MIAITAATLFTPLERIEQPLLLVEDESIVEVTSQAHREAPAGSRGVDFPGMVLAPGFIDIHIHGGAGHDVMEADSSALARIERHLVRHGVTAYLPTTVTAPQNRILQALEHLGKSIVLNSGNKDRACSVGIHLEGPFISHAKRGV